MADLVFRTQTVTWSNAHFLLPMPNTRSRWQVWRCKDKYLKYYIRQARKNPKKPGNETLLNCTVYAIFDLKVRLPYNRRENRYYESLTKRVLTDLEGHLNELDCNTGDFQGYFELGNITIGHLGAELFSIFLDQVSTRFKEYGHILFAERVTISDPDCEPSVKEAEKIQEVEYKIHLCYERPFPPEFNQLFNLMIGYLNALFEDEPFDIKQRIEEFIKHRAMNPGGR